MGPVTSGAGIGQAGTGGAPGAERNAYLDLLRVLAICGVLAGHWLLSSVTEQRGQLSGESAMPFISWSAWGTLAFQVVPVFFLIGGYVSALSWDRHRAVWGSQRGWATWTSWTRRRALRLLWPVALYVTVATAAAWIAGLAGAPRGEVATAGWSIAYHLWFLPAYFLMIALTPVMLAAHRRWGLLVPAAMAVAAAVVDLAVLGDHLSLAGYLNYPLVWGSMYQWGFAWQDGTLTRSRWHALALAGGGAGVLAALLAWSPFPADMIGAGPGVSNTNPPSVGLLAFAAAQAGLVIAAEPVAARWLDRPNRPGRPGRPEFFERLSARSLHAYLWHLVPVLIVAVALYPSGLLPAATPGSATWWQTRPAWLAILAVTMIGVIALLDRPRRWLGRLPDGLGPAGPWSPALVAAGLAVTIYALSRLAITGFAANGRPSASLVGAFAAGLLMLAFSGREPAPDRDRHRASAGPRSGVEAETSPVQGAQP